MILGIDEAGRGCVIGPMVMACASIDSMEENALLRLGVKDSKKLSPKRREELYEPVRHLCEVRTVHLSAHKLTKMMDEHNLNEIEAMTIAEMLKDVPETACAYIDAPDNIPANFAKRIRRLISPTPKLVCENKADDKYPIVAAASIVAKVERDREIEKIKKIIGIDFNSGYTSDPMTTAFLAKHATDANVQPYLRHKWATLEKLKQKKMSDY